MSQLLMKYTKDFQVSRPIFHLSVSEKNITAEKYNPIHQWIPTPIEGDVISELVCRKYNEHFDMANWRFVIHPKDIARNAMTEIKASIAQFISYSLAMKNPKQSNLYKWFRYSVPETHEIEEVLIMVYKYLLSFCNEGTMETYNIQHRENAIALLTAIMEKYER